MRLIHVRFVPVSLLLFFATNCLVTGQTSDTLKQKTATRAYSFGPPAVELGNYNMMYRQLFTASSEAEWKLNTKIIEGNPANKMAFESAKKTFASFTGITAYGSMAEFYQQNGDSLSDIDRAQIARIKFLYGANPASVSGLVEKRIAVQAAQTEKLFGFNYKVNGVTVTANDVDKVLWTSDSLPERLAYWTASKEVGKVLKQGLDSSRTLNNEVVSAAGYKDFFDYQASEYGLSGPEMVALCDSLIRQIWPLYRELHTYARYTLAERYHQPVPDMLPAHWLPNRWGQDWSEMITDSSLSIDAFLVSKEKDFIIRKSESFYISLGFDSLPRSFYDKSSLYPFAKDARIKKNNHASAWHIDLDTDIRSLMSIEPNTGWWSTTLHELGHIYYFRSYSTPEIPYILREGANRGFHEAMGSLMGLASLHEPLLKGQGMLTGKSKRDPMKQLLKEAMDYIVHIPWGAGVMTHFENELYAGKIPADKFNSAWWALVKKYQGIEPPSARGETYCDAATKTHIIDDQAQYYDYSISNVLLFMFHQHIAKNILKQVPHATNYWGSKATGDFIKELMKPGATKDWRVLLQEKLGSGMSAQPMIDYFQPLMEYLKKENKGRKYTLPETI